MREALDARVQLGDRNLGEIESAGGAQCRAGRLQALGQAVRTERALAHHPPLFLESRGSVRAGPGTVPAPDAPPRVDENRPGRTIPTVGQRGAGVHAGRLLAVIAGERQVEAGDTGDRGGVECHDLPPAPIRSQVILDRARELACLAARAPVRVEVKRRRHVRRALLRPAYRGRPLRAPCPSPARGSRSSPSRLRGSTSRWSRSRTPA